MDREADIGVLDQLASALGRNDEQPNVALAEALVAKRDRKVIADLAAALGSGTTAQQNDAIKVLYEIGERQPGLIAGHAAAFLALLASKNNRNVWGAMSALATIASAKPKDLSTHLAELLAAGDRGSVIAKDRLMSILSQLAQAGERKALPALLDRLETAAPSQFPMYAELALPAVTPAQRDRYRTILETRLAKIEASAKRARIEKLLRRLEPKQLSGDDV